MFPFSEEVLVLIGIHLRNTQRQLFLKTHEKESVLSSDISEHPPGVVIKGEVWPMISPKRDTQGSGPLHPPASASSLLLRLCDTVGVCRRKEVQTLFRN